MPTSTAGSWTDPSHTSGRRAAGSAGFTLIELAIVVLLISLFTVISVPLFSQIGKGDLRGSARRLAGAMKYLYNEAALSGQEHRLVFNFAEHSYRAEILETDGSLGELDDSTARATLKDGVSFSDISLPGRGTFTSGEVTVRIHPTGWLEETIIHLQDSNKNALTLRVNPLTGSSEIFAGYRAFQVN